MVLMYEEEELYSGLEGSSGGSVTRLMDTQYRISYRLYWIDYINAMRNVPNYKSSTSLLSPVPMFPVVCN